MRKIAAAAAAIPVIAYVWVRARFRHLIPGSGNGAGSAGDGVPAPGRASASSVTDLRTQGGASIRTNSGALRGASPTSARSGDRDSVFTPMAVPAPVRTVERAPLPRDQAFVPSAIEPDLVQNKSQGRIPGLDVARPFVPPPVRTFDPGRRSDVGYGVLQFSLVTMSVTLLVAALLLGLPAKPVAGGAPPSFLPTVPEASTDRSQGDLPLDVAFNLQFSKPMNEASVESALTISPDAGLKFQWDATGENLALAPASHWDPFTQYVVVVGTTATDQQGLGLSSPLSASFKSGSLTSGQLIATEVVDSLVSPGTAFQITFTRPVKLLTVQEHLSVSLMATCPAVNGVSSLPLNGVCPPVNGVSPQPTCPSDTGSTVPPLNGVCPVQIPLDIVGDDPTDAASQVFTATPTNQLEATSTFVVKFDVGTGHSAATDAAGAALLPVAPLQVTTMSAPEVLRFRPQDGSVTYDTNSPISVRFTTAMDTKSTAAAFTVTADGVPVSGGKYWSEGNTVLTLTPRTSFKIGATVVATVSSSARAVGGLHLGGTATATFRVAARPPAKIGYGGSPTKSSPWYASEVYYMALMNCTRTGGWVTSGGTCSSVTHHTLPAQGRLGLSAGISNNVSRPYAKYMADNRLLSHYLRGTTPHTRLCRAGYCGASWGENIASPSSYGRGGMISIEIFYQNEYWCRCEHYANIMNGHFSVAGVGVWFSNSVRVAIDFYG